MRHIDNGSIFIIIVTFILFAIAIFVNGFTHNLLVEAGVFLVSVKLIMLAYKASKNFSKIKQELTEIKELLKKNNIKG